MNFSMFQTATATMQLMSVDGYGKPTVSSSFSVDIDPVMGYKRTFTADGEEINGIETIISANDNIDLTEKNYRLVYNGMTFQVERLEPFYSIGSNVVEHYEVVLR